MPNSFYLMALVIGIAFLLVVYYGIDAFVIAIKQDIKQENKVQLIEQTHSEQIAKTEQIINNYKLLVEEVEMLKKREAENEKLQQALYRAMVNQYFEKFSKSTVKHDSPHPYVIMQSNYITGDSIKYKPTSIRDLNPEYQNHN